MHWSDRVPVFALLAVLSLAACKARETPADGGASGDGAATVDVPEAPRGEISARDIAMYPLDMKKMRSWVNATKGVMAAYEKDPAAAAEAEKNKPESNESPARQIARMESTPLMKRVLRENGLTPRDYVMIMGSYMQAGMVGGALSMNPNAKIPEGQSPENIKFVQANKTELEQLFREAGMAK